MIRSPNLCGIWQWRRVAAQLDPEDSPMKADIHPQYDAIEATCSCGNVIKTRSTLSKNIHLDVCSECHPFYTGKQKVLDAGGRIDRFKQRFGVFGSNK
jgi:large subunit ribosomal protein L31